MRTFLALVAFTLSAAAATYTLKPGDTLGAVARQHRVSVDALARANNIANPNRVFAGQVLTIPGATPAAPARVHVVASGDTLGALHAPGSVVSFRARPLATSTAKTWDST